MKKDNNLEIIKKFYFNNKLDKCKEFVGFVFYGSRMQGIVNELSDLDLLAIFSNNINCLKGVTVVDDVKISYYFRTIESLYERINADYNSNSDSILSILGYGEILFSNGNYIEDAKEYVLEKFKNGINKLSLDDCLYEAYNLKEKLLKLKILLDSNNPQFISFYYSLLNNIKDFYTKRFGYSNISNSKIYDVYTNNQLAILQHKSIPPIEFRNIYISCLKYDNRIEMYENIEKLFYLSVENLEINHNEYQLVLGRRKY